MKKIFLIALFCLNLPTMISLGKFNIGIIETLAQSQGENNNWENWSDYGGSNSGGTLNGGSLPEVVVTGTDTGDNNIDIWDTYLDIQNTIDGGNALGEGNEVVCYGEKPSDSGESGGSTGSPTAPNINVTPNNPKTNQKNDIVVIDCDTFGDVFSAAKSEVSSVIDKFYKTESKTIGINHYLSSEEYIDMVWYDEEHEYATLLVEYEDYGIMLTVPEPGTETEGSFSYTPNRDYYRAIIHNHPTPTSLSAQDIKALLEAHFNGCTNLNTIIAWHPDFCGYYYCATIVSEEKARAFYERFKDAVDEDNHNWTDEDINKFINKHKKEFKSIKKSWDGNIGDIYRLQAVLDNFDAGVSLTTVWYNGEQNSISSVKTLKPDKGKRLQYIRCGELYF
ncbi:MAG: hypothetical protein J5953_04255 [Prevotella sp.]|nr:hypothetical protein [Prevotella sp.]